MSIWDEAELLNEAPKAQTSTKNIWDEAELLEEKPKAIKPMQQKTQPLTTPSREQLIADFRAKTKAQNEEIDKQLRRDYIRIGTGGTLQGLSALPINKIPFLGSALGGALFEAGDSIIKGESGQDILKKAGTGAVVGASAEGAIKAIPIIGKPLAQSKAGKAIIDKSNEALKPLLDSNIAKNIGNTLTKEINLPNIKPTKQISQEPAIKVSKEIENLINPKPKTAIQVSKATQEALTPQASGNIKTSSLPQTVAAAKGTPREIKQIIKNDLPTYQAINNKDLINQATNELKGEFENELSRLTSAESFDALDFEKSRQIAKELFGMGDYKRAVNLIDNVSSHATKKGQEIQALSLWSNMTPEGAVYKAQKLINEYNRKRQPRNHIKLTEKDVETIKNLQLEALNTSDELSRNQALAKSAKYMSELIPKNFLQKLKAYRNISLLLNPKTLGRNIVGNTLFNSADLVSKGLASGIDNVLSKFTGQRTRALPSLKEYSKGLTQGAKVGFQEALQGIDTRGLGQRFDLGSGRTFNTKQDFLPIQGQGIKQNVANAFKNVNIGTEKALAPLETALDIGLRTPDRAFYEATFAESVDNMMRAQGLTKPTQEILEQAEREALEAVFQNESKLSKMALDTRKALNRVGTRDFGLGDVLIPYAQTPANLAQQGINYSPLGLIKGAGNLLQGNQRQASLDLARSLAGTGLIGGGYGLAKAGMATPSQFNENYKTNKTIRENLQPLGIRPNQIGDFSYSQFQPMSIPLSVGNAMAYGDNPLQAGINTIVELPYMQNVARALKDVQEGDYAQAGVNILSSIPSQFVPTLGGQIAQTIDPYQRETHDPNPFKRGVNQAIAKIPFASQTLPEKIDVTGQPIERYSTEGARELFDIFLNPTFINEKTDDPVLSELKIIYDNTKETRHFMPSVDRKLKFTDNSGNTKQLTLTGQEISDYQKELGQRMYEEFNFVMDLPQYAEADDYGKIKLLEKAKKLVKAEVDDEMWDKKNRNKQRSYTY